MSTQTPPTVDPDIAKRMPPAVRHDKAVGGRAAVPAGTLPTPYFGTQGDEQREPPPGSPVPVPPSPVIERDISPAPAPGRSR